MRLAVYLRVSTTEQDHAAQRGPVDAYIKAMSPQPVSVTYYTDTASGAHTDRPEYQRLITACMAHQHDALLVCRLDRLARSASTAIRLILDLDDHGVAFISATQPALNLGPSVPFRRTILMVFAELAEIEREMIVTRTKEGIVAARARGKRIGRPATISADIIAEIKRLNASGHTYRAIAESLHISTGTISRILNPRQEEIL